MVVWLFLFNISKLCERVFLVHKSDKIKKLSKGGIALNLKFKNDIFIKIINNLKMRTLVFTLIIFWKFIFEYLYQRIFETFCIIFIIKMGCGCL